MTRPSYVHPNDLSTPGYCHWTHPFHCHPRSCLRHYSYQDPSLAWFDTSTAWDLVWWKALWSDHVILGSVGCHQASRFLPALSTWLNITWKYTEHVSKKSVQKVYRKKKIWVCSPLAHVIICNVHCLLSRPEPGCTIHIFFHVLMVNLLLCMVVISRKWDWWLINIKSLVLHKSPST